MTITAIRNNVLFTFVDEINSRNEFTKGATDSGIVIAGDTFDASAKQSRWVKVFAVGPDVKNVKVGDVALLPALRWTEGIKHDGFRFWKTDENEIVAIARGNADGAQPTPLNNWVLFTQNKNGHVRQMGLIAVVGGVTDTPCGTAYAAGPDVEPEVVGSTIYYSDTNFTDTTKWAGKEFAFIKDENILVYTQE